MRRGIHGLLDCNDELSGNPVRGLADEFSEAG